MTSHDVKAIARRSFSDFMAWARDFLSSVKSGEIWKRLKIWVRANWIFSLISLGLASLLYFLIREAISYKGSRMIPVEIQVNGENGPMSATSDPREITVSVRGAQKDVHQFVTSELPIKLQFDAAEFVTTNLESGPVYVQLKRQLRNRDIPGLREFGLTPDDKLPAVTVSLDYDKSDTPGDVSFFIEPPKLVGTPYHGEVRVTEFNPQAVTLHGGRKKLEMLRDGGVVRPELPEINVENLVGGVVVRRCEIILPEKLRSVAVLSPETNATVTVEIIPRNGAKTLEKLPLRLSVPPGISLPKDCLLVPAHVSATVTGYEKSMETLSNELVTAYADLPPPPVLDFTPGATNVLRVKVEVPYDREIVGVEPDPQEVLLIMPIEGKNNTIKGSVENGKPNGQQ